MISGYFKRKQMEEERREREETAKRLAVGSIFGAAIGSIAGVLLAPKSGKETRQDITNSVNEVTDTVKSTVDEGVEKTKEMHEKFVTDVKNAVDKVKKDKEESSEVIALEESEENFEDEACSLDDLEDDSEKEIDEEN